MLNLSPAALFSRVNNVVQPRPQEWLRAGVGASLGILSSVWLCQWVFGLPVALLLIGPVGASAILLFAVPAVAHFGGHTLAMAALATGLTLLCMFLLGCLHPPGGAVALNVVLAGPALQQLGELAILPVMLHAAALLAFALIYNNLTGVRYPKRPTPVIDLQHTRDAPPAMRVGITTADMDAALDEFGEFVA